MNDTADWPSDAPDLGRIATLPVAERRVLAALAVVGRASLSGGELAELTEVKDVTPLVADLEQRELIERDEKQRYRALGGLGEEIRQTDAALSAGERMLQYVMTLARGGQLTPERLLDDAEAVLGLTEWAADCQQWEQLLELVKTLQACFEIESRVEEWLTLLDRARSAARALDDRQSEVWVSRQTIAALASADNLSTVSQGANEPGTSISLQRIALWTLGLIVAAAAGGAAGYAIGDSSGTVGPGVTTTVTVGGQTVTKFKTVTSPPTTVFSTATVTTTVVSTAPPPPSETRP